MGGNKVSLIAYYTSSKQRQQECCCGVHIEMCSGGNTVKGVKREKDTGGAVEAGEGQAIRPTASSHHLLC